MKAKLARGVFWLAFAKLLVNVLALCSTLVLARLLTPDDFGVVAIVTTLLSIVGPLTELSLGAALIHHSAPEEEHFHTAWTMNLIRALGLASLFLAFAPVVAAFYADDRLLAAMVAIGASVFIGGLSNPKIVTQTRDLEFWPTFLVAVSQKLLGFLVGLTLAIIYRNHWALLGGTLASQFTGVLVSYFVQPYKPKWSLAYCRELWSFSVWVSLGQIVNTLNWRLDHLLVGSFLGSRALGVYTMGDNLAGLPTREATSPLEQTLFPGFRNVAEDRTQLVRVYLRAQALVSSIALPIGFACGLMAKPLVELVLGHQWSEAVVVVQVLSCIFAIQSLSATVHPLALALGATRTMFYRDVFAFLVRVPIILCGMLFFGLIGIVYGRAISGSISVLMNMYVVRRLIGLSIARQFANSARSLVAVAFMGGLLMSVGDSCVVTNGLGLLNPVVNFIVVSLAGLFLYILVHGLLWVGFGRPIGPESDVLDLLRKVLNRLRL
jgi:PST family polysaccharide transporter